MTQGKAWYSDKSNIVKIIAAFIVFLQFIAFLGILFFPVILTQPFPCLSCLLFTPIPDIFLMVTYWKF